MQKQDEIRLREIWINFQNLTTEQQSSMFPHLFGAIEIAIKYNKVHKNEMINIIEESINYCLKNH